MEKRNGVWLAAVSGGPDSMALADMCLRSGTAFAVAHVNYHHRPEADEEEAWVRQWCLEHGIVCHVRNEAFVYTGNFEAAARTWRYDFFEQLVRQFGYAGILTGHHQDDLIETYIMQKEKNIIPEYWGLKDSIMYHGILLERPLLHMTKKELEDYCSEKGIRWYLDATNLQDDYARNKVRHEVIDHLSQMERTMILREIRMENAVMTERRCRVRTEIRDGETELSAYRRYQTDDRLALLRMIAEPQKQGPGLSRKFLEEADHILMNHNDFVIDVRDQQLVQKNGRFFLHKPFCTYSYVCADLQEVMELGTKETFMIGPGSPGVNAVTVREEDWPLTIRSWQSGDEIRMRYGTKSVHRYFIDRHIPRYMRQSWPVVVNASGSVILVPGLGCDILHFSTSPDFNVLQYLL